jgi:hypothetical protein
MPEQPLPDPKTDPTAPPQGAAVPSALVVPLRRGGEESSRANASPAAANASQPVLDASLVATDVDPELEAALAARPRRRWRLSMPASRAAWSPPVTGALSVIFAIAALFKAPLFLAPLAILLALIAGWRGHHAWAVIGLGTGLVALFTSVWFWTWLGLAWLYHSWG